MKMRMKVQGIASVRMMLRSVGEKVPDTARKQMHRSAARIVKRAQLYVPEDTTALRESIRVEKTYGDRRRLQIDIIAGGAAVVLDGGKGINLDQYAWIIHERYSDMNPGKKTKEKMAANPGVLIGERFLERANEEEEKKLRNNIIVTINQITRGLKG